VRDNRFSHAFRIATLIFSQSYLKAYGRHLPVENGVADCGNLVMAPPLCHLLNREAFLPEKLIVSMGQVQTP